jgi:hypothetical protein
MSDPMTNVEIEDILSSIRRLVSEDHRPAARKPAARSTPDKLVLTPALRIVPDAPARPQPDGAVAQEATTAFDALSHRAAAAVLEAALSRRPDDWEPDGSEVTATGAEDWTVEWEAADPAIPEFVSSRAAAAPPAESVAPQAEPAVEADEAPMDWTDTLDPPTADAAPDAAPRISLTDEEDATFLDEDVLRDLIRDILREELQGALGERITRNVRKLVRAEIARALASRDFD